MILVNESICAPGWCVTKMRPPAWTATFVAKGTFDLRPGATAVPSTRPIDVSGDLFAEDDPALELLYPGDYAPFKPKGEVLVSATCHAPGGRPVQVLRAGFQVGKLAKSIAVVGDRIWKKGLIGRKRPDPTPFVRMPIRYANAFGGKGFPKNPVGKGMVEEMGADGVSFRRPPNLETPELLVTDSSSTVEPSCFGPIHPTWHPRKVMVGSFDAAWKKNRWPWFPENFDWNFFNAAPRDQQVSGYLRGDEKMRFENLHPSRPSYETALPGLRVRCFFREFRGDGKLREVPMNLDTLWVDMDSERAVLVWRGTADVRGEALNDRDLLLLSSEPLKEAPKTIDHFERIVARRMLLAKLGPEDAEPAPPPAAKPAEKKRPAAPPPGPEDDPEAELAAMFPPKPAPPPAPVPPELDVPDEPPAPEPEPPPEPPPPPPRREWCVERHARKESFAGLDLSDVDLSGLDFSGADFSGAVLSRAKLSKTNLAGAVFAGALLFESELEDADLRKADFTGADLTAARLDRADLGEATLADAIASQAVFREAKLGSAKGPGALLDGAVFTKADLKKAQLPGANLTDAVLHEADLTEANLAGCAAERLLAYRLVAERADLTGLKASKSFLPAARFRGAKGPRSVWIRSFLEGADFTGAELAKADFATSKLRSALFSGAVLREARLDGAFLRGAEFLRVDLFRARLAKANLTSANLAESNLFEADLGEAVLAGARLDGANVKRTAVAT